MSLLSKVKSGLKGVLQSRENIIFPVESITKISIGLSYRNRSINCFKIGDGKLKILFVSGMHGNEVGTVKLTYRMIDWLHKYHLEFSQISFHIVPCLNPDGFAQALKNRDFLRGGKIGRFNNENVDLNRNFDTPSFQKESLWSFGKEYSKNIKVDCGKVGNSEPETQAIIRFISENNIKFIFSFHNVGADVLPAKNIFSMKVGSIYAKEAKLKLMSEHEWLNLKQTGTFKEWCELKEISFLEIETAKRWGSDWVRQLPAIKAAITYLNSGNIDN